MFVLIVSETTDPGANDVRCAARTLEAAKSFADAEVERAYGKTLTWRDGLGGSRATLDGLDYDISPTKEI